MTAVEASPNFAYALGESREAAVDAAGKLSGKPGRWVCEVKGVRVLHKDPRSDATALSERAIRLAPRGGPSSGSTEPGTTLGRQCQRMLINRAYIVKDVFDRLDRARKFWWATAFEFGPGRRPLLWMVLLISLAVGALTVASILYLPTYLYPPLSDGELVGIAPEKRVEFDQAQRALQSQAMTTLLQGVGVLAVLVGAGIGWHTTRQGQITERFMQAVDHLGDEKLDVRLGGIHALARIAKNSVADRSAIFQILSAYVRARAPRIFDADPPASDSCMDEYEGAGDNERLSELGAREFLQQLYMRAVDIQTIVSILIQYHPWLNVPQVHLAYVDLRRGALKEAQLRGAFLLGADLRDSNLFGADLRSSILADADLRKAELSAADLQWAYLMGADLREAQLIDADLRWAKLYRANLRGAALNRANLQNADLREAQLIDADLRWARLYGADLREADLQGAWASPDTVWPQGFDDGERRRRGIHL